MKSLIRIVPLYDRTTGAWVDAELYDAIDAKNADDFEGHWKPQLDEAIAALRRSGSLTPASVEAINAQDAHWHWREKAASRSQHIAWRSFAIECEGLTQGMMFVNLSWFGRAAEHKGRELVYVDLLSAAPWNRPRLTPQPKYGSIGRILLAMAISLSKEEGFRGRVGLHSLSQSESWYRDRCGMTDLGPDASGSQGLRYFEMTEAQADAFLA